MPPSSGKNVLRLPKIRRERPTDATAIHRVHAAAFATDAEGQLVDTLRCDGDLVVSLVAEVDGGGQQNGAIVGHIALSPVTVSPDTLRGKPCTGVGLAPLAVLPVYQRRGIGAQLIEAGLSACREAGFSFAVVLGEPAYYGRFGFRAASEWGLESEYDAGDAFMVRSLGDANDPRATIPHDGLIRYATAFAALG